MGNSNSHSKVVPTAHLCGVSRILIGLSKSRIGVSLLVSLLQRG